MILFQRYNVYFPTPTYISCSLRYVLFDHIVSVTKKYFYVIAIIYISGYCKYAMLQTVSRWCKRVKCGKNGVKGIQIKYIFMWSNPIFNINVCQIK